MKRIILFILLFKIEIIFSQIIPNCSESFNSANELVEILIGEGIEYSNATFSGFDCSAGFFDGNSNIGFESGLVMATGGLESITPGSFSNISGGAGTDSDLTLQLQTVGATSTNLNNLIVLEFDFIPTSDVVTFEYVFASNEYPSFTCSQFNDIFGFFLSGPGINGPFDNDAINIALVPDPNNPEIYTETPVIINSINSGISSNFDSSPCDNIDPNWQEYSIFFNDNPNESTVNFPGFTVPLTATANVTACQTYHIKLAIADVADGALNSAVFLNENSFNSPPPIEYSIESNVLGIISNANIDSLNLYEGCGIATINFIRPESVFNEIVFDFQTFGNATYLSDYYYNNINSNQLIMEENINSVSLEIIPNFDEIQEGVEQLAIIIQPVDYGCYESDPDTVIFKIFDQPQLFIQDITSDILIDCPGDQVELFVTPGGGVSSLMSNSNYNFQWAMGGNESTQIYYPNEEALFCVQVTDICGMQVNECIEINIVEHPPLIANSDILYTCENTLNTLCIDVNGGNQDYTFLWSNGDDSICIYDFPGQYSVDISDGCGNQIQIYPEIFLDEAPDPIFDIFDLPSQEFAIQINNYTENSYGLEYFWDFGDLQYSEIYNPNFHFYENDGIYNIKLSVTTLINSCYKESTKSITLSPHHYLYIPNTFSPNGDKINDLFIPYITGINSFEIFIFDRWGKQVFQSNDVNNNWNGISGNKESSIGVYSYIITFTKPYDEKIYSETGYVNLIR